MKAEPPTHLTSDRSEGAATERDYHGVIDASRARSAWRPRHKKPSQTEQDCSAIEVRHHRCQGDRQTSQILLSSPFHPLVAETVRKNCLDRLESVPGNRETTCRAANQTSGFRGAPSDFQFRRNRVSLSE